MGAGREIIFKPQILLLGLVLVSVLVLSGCTSNQGVSGPSEIVIGYNADQSTGATAAFGAWGAQGFKTAVDEINANGGVLGKNITAVITDDKNNASLSMQNLKQLVSQNAIAVIGPASSAISMSWLDYAQENELIVINPIAGASGITTKFSERPRNYIFRIANVDIESVRLIIAWGVKETNNGKFAVIYDTTAYGTQGVKDVTEVLARWGKTPVFTKSFDRGTSVANLTKIIESARDAGADGIVFYALVDSNADLLKALDNVKGYNPVVMGTAANAVNMWKLAGNLSTKLVFTSPMSADFNERANVLNQKIIAKYGKAPAILSTAASGYDAVYFLKAAIEKAGTTDGVAIRDAMENIDSYPGIMRTFARPFTKQNHELLTVTDAFLAHWVDGKIVLLNEDVSKLEIR
jgi:branched-chain amino acid transport system substrate-binding protein